ncbi:MAG: hypothetical protein IT364_11895 [Candidatus Hydrogenedentes bacterium]|nr:hypothetical protein [Candidatus Hydrogenedentota bacterium]
MTNAPVTSLEQAIALAELEVHKLGWKKNEYEVTSSGLQGDVWWVEIWRIPMVPGGYVEIEITSGGKVTVFGGA